MPAAAIRMTDTHRLSRYSPAIDPDFISPCLAVVALLPPSGEDWLHEIKHPGYRLIARRNGRDVRLFAERGEDWTCWFPFVVESMRALPVKSCIIDGDLIRCDEHGNTVRGPLP